MLTLNCWRFSISAVFPRAVRVIHNIVISGFNTDIEFDGVVYHVQTEDKGLNARMILTLVYNGGTILASKRSPYDDLVTDNFDGSQISDRLGRQHKLICAAVRAGRMEDLKEMSRKVAPAVAGASAIARPNVAQNATPIGRPDVISAFVPVGPPTDFAKTTIAAPDILNIPIPVGKVETPQITSVTSPYDREVVLRAESNEIEFEPIEIPTFPPVEEIVPTGTSLVEVDEEFIFEEVNIIEEEFILDATAVEVVSELSGIDRPINEKLSLELLGEAKFKGGDRTTVSIMVCRGTNRKVVKTAQIMIKGLGSTFRPVIFHAKTDANGLANVHLQLPHFRAGRAALLIRAMADGEEIELRRIVTPG